MSQTAFKEKTSGGLRTRIIMAWLIVGTLDLSAATIQTLIYGREPVKMFQFIASGVFGPDALSGGMIYAVLGVLFHYIIALGWTLLFFFLYIRVHFLSKSIVLTGILYGLLVWFVMNRIVLPLSNTPPIPFRLAGAITAALILIGAIGLPLAIIAKKSKN